VDGYVPAGKAGDSGGFTLTELMFVVLIIRHPHCRGPAVLAQTAGHAEKKTCYASQRTIEGAVMVWQAQENSNVSALAGVVNGGHASYRRIHQAPARLPERAASRRRQQPVERRGRLHPHRHCYRAALTFGVSERTAATAARRTGAFPERVPRGYCSMQSRRFVGPDLGETLSTTREVHAARAFENVRIEGHLIDSGIVSRVMDHIIALGGEFETLSFTVGVPTTTHRSRRFECAVPTRSTSTRSSALFSRTVLSRWTLQMPISLQRPKTASSLTTSTRRRTWRWMSEWAAAGCT